MNYQVGDVVLIMNRNFGHQAGEIPANQVGLVCEVEKVIIPRIEKNERPTIKVGGRNFHISWHMDPDNLMFLGRKDAQGRFRLHGKYFPHDLRAIQQYVNERPEKYKVAAPVVPKPAPLKKTLEGERKKAIEKLEEARGLCSYTGVTSSPDAWYQIGDVCHARLRASEYIFDTVRNKHNEMSVENKATHIEMVDWLINRSHFRDAFITKDAQFACEQYVEYDCSKPMWLIFSAAVALRGFHEFKQQMQSWVKYKDVVPEHLLWVTCLLFNDMGEYTGTTDGHRTWSSGLEAANVQKWVKNGFNFDKLKKTPAKQDGTMFAMGAVNGCGNQYVNVYGNKSSLNNLIEEKIPKGKKNPFGIEEVKRLTPEQVLKIMLEVFQ